MEDNSAQAVTMNVSNSHVFIILWDQYLVDERGLHICNCNSEASSLVRNYNVNK